MCYVNKNQALKKTATLLTGLKTKDFFVDQS